MKGTEISQQLLLVNRQEKCFIKWWRHQNEFAEIEEIEGFLACIDPDQEYAGYELLSMDDLWRELKRIEPRRILLGVERGRKVIRWQHRGQDGSMREDIYPYNANALMAVFEVENGGTTLA